MAEGDNNALGCMRQRGKVVALDLLIVPLVMLLNAFGLYLVPRTV